MSDTSGRLSLESLPRTSEHDGRLGHLSSIPGYGGRMPGRPTPEPIAPGQESVWDYPRPPAIVASDEQIVIRLGGLDICETDISWRILETSHPPTYYLPRTAFHRGCAGSQPRPQLLRVEGPGVVPRCRRWFQDRSTRGVVLPNPEPHYAAIRGHVAIYAGLMDECLGGR